MHSGPVERQEFQTSVLCTVLYSPPNKKGAVGTGEGFVSHVTESGITETQVLLHLYVLFCFLSSWKEK